MSLCSLHFYDLIIDYHLGSEDCIPTIIEFLTNCVQQGVIQLNVEELVKDVKITVSIPKR